MVTKSQHRLNPLVGKWNRRYNYQGFPRPGGVNTEASPGSIKPEQFTQLVNSRWSQGGVVPRGGYQNLFDDILHDADACGHLAPQFDIATPFRAWWIMDGCPGESAGVGSSVGFYDPEQDPIFQRSIWFDGATSVRIGAFGSTAYVGVDNALRRINIVQASFGTEQIEVAGSLLDVPIYEWDSGVTVTVIFEFDGVVYIGLDDPGGDHIDSYDGVTVQPDFALPAVPVASATFRDYAVIGLADGKLYYREWGASPATWTLIGTVTPGIYDGPNSMSSHKDVLYIATARDEIWSWDGTTLAKAYDVDSGSPGATCKCLTDAPGYLFYGWTDTGDTTYIGRFDAAGPTWVDKHKDLSAQFATVNDIKCLGFYKNELIAILTGGSVRVAYTIEQASAGTWGDERMQAGYASLDQHDLVFV